MSDLEQMMQLADEAHDKATQVWERIRLTYPIKIVQEAQLAMRSSWQVVEDLSKLYQKTKAV